MKKSVILLMWLTGLTMMQTAAAQGNAAAGESKSALCASCHGAGGNSTVPENPKLAGQSAKYIAKQLADYQSGARQNAIMTGMSASLSEQDILDIAAYYASQEVNVTGAESDDSLDLGERLYRAGNKEISVAACTSCHSPTGQGNPPAGFPALSGQHTQYTLAQLKAFRAGERNNDMNSMMRSVVERLTDRELEALANYIAGLN